MQAAEEPVEFLCEHCGSQGLVILPAEPDERGVPPVGYCPHCGSSSRLIVHHLTEPLLLDHA